MARVDDDEERDEMEEDDDDEEEEEKREKRWVHTACVLSLPASECWFVDGNGGDDDWVQCPIRAVKGVGAKHEASAEKWGVDWENRRALTCQICQKKGAPTQCAYAECKK